MSLMNLSMSVLRNQIINQCYVDYGLLIGAKILQSIAGEIWLTIISQKGIYKNFNSHVEPIFTLRKEI